MCKFCDVDKNEDNYELKLGTTEGVDFGILGNVENEISIRKDPKWNIASVTTITIGDGVDFTCDGNYIQIKYCPFCGRGLES